MPDPQDNSQAPDDEGGSFKLLVPIIIVVALILLLLIAKLISRGGQNNYNPDLAGQTIIVTGSNTGIGFTATMKMAQLGPKTIIMACRSQTRALAAITTIMEKLTSAQKQVTQLEFVKLDLSDLNSVKEFAAEIKSKYNKIDMLVNNAGMLVQVKDYSVQKHELMFATNHLGHFLLTKLLLDNIKACEQARIINLSSDAHKMCKGSIDLDDLNSDKKFEGFPTYAMTKFCNVLYTKQLEKYLKEQGITNVKTASVHPGVVRTEFARNFFEGQPAKKCFCYTFCWPCCCPMYWCILKSPSEGAQTTLHTCLIDHKELQSGAYYKDCHLQEELLNSGWEEQAATLWKKSEDMVAEFA